MKGLRDTGAPNVEEPPSRALVVGSVLFYLVAASTSRSLLLARVAARSAADVPFRAVVVSGLSCWTGWLGMSGLACARVGAGARGSKGTKGDVQKSCELTVVIPSAIA